MVHLVKAIIIENSIVIEQVTNMVVNNGVIARITFDFIIKELQVIMVLLKLNLL